MTVLHQWSHIFYFHWSEDQPVRERQKKVVRRALKNSTYDFERWTPGTAERGKVQVVFVPLPGTEQGWWDVRTMTLALNEKYGTKKSYPINYGGEIMQHEMGHVTDSLVLTDSTRKRILDVWCPPIPGRSTHDWWEGDYQDRVGEVFADAWAHVYSGKVIGSPAHPLVRFFHFNRRWGHHRLTSEGRAVIREVCG